jgi:hypothetical protein
MGISKRTMTKPKLHLDADTSHKQLWQVLCKLGHDVTRTPQPGLPRDASDEYQLLWAAAQGRIIFTFNLRDFIHLASQYPRHAGIILAHQRSFTIAELIKLLNLALREHEAEAWAGQVRWLSDWRPNPE